MVKTHCEVEGNGMKATIANINILPRSARNTDTAMFRIGILQNVGLSYNKESESMQ